jgi:uncharacterized protein (TIGR03067 family)
MIAAGAAVAVLAPRSGEPSTAAARGSVPPPTGRAIPSPRPARPTDREKLQGTWVAVEEVLGGKPVDDPDLAKIGFTFADDRVTFRTKRGSSGGTYQLDPNQSPRVLDLLLGEQTVMNVIYEAADDRLKLCWRKGGPRPGGFDTINEPDTILFVLEKR